MRDPVIFEEAIRFAVRAHQGMTRKTESTPYIVHPMEAATICATITSDPEVLAAAGLHDTVEDTETTLAQIEEAFGERVAALVASETEDKRSDRPPAETWRIRKEEALETLRNASDPGVKILWLGDKLANIRGFYRAWQISGNELWRQFNQKDPAQQAWYYRSIVTLLDDLKDSEAWQELDYDVQKIFEGV